MLSRSDNVLFRLQPALLYIQSHFRYDLTVLRLTYAHAMLYEPNHRVQEICFKSGFHTPEYFSRAFKKKYGISPEQHHMDKLMSKE